MKDQNRTYNAKHQLTSWKSSELHLWDCWQLYEQHKLQTERKNKK